MSVSNVSSSLSSTGGEILHRIHLPLLALAVGAGLGVTGCLVATMRNINDTTFGQCIKKNFNHRIAMVLFTLGAAGSLTSVGLVWPNRSIVVLTAASLGFSSFFLYVIKYWVQQKSTALKGDVKEGLETTVNRAFLTLIPTAAMTTILLASAYVQAEQKV